MDEDPNRPWVLRGSGGWENPLIRCGLAFTGANHALESTNALAEDGLLTGLEASSLHLTGTELVVLSACDSGAGDVKIGEGVMSLRKAFRIAGAQTVLASHWPISDKATRPLERTAPRARSLRPERALLPRRRPRPNRRTLLRAIPTASPSASRRPQRCWGFPRRPPAASLPAGSSNRPGPCVTSASRGARSSDFWRAPEPDPSTGPLGPSAVVSRPLRLWYYGATAVSCPSRRSGAVFVVSHNRLRFFVFNHDHSTRVDTYATTHLALAQQVLLRATTRCAIAQSRSELRGVPCRSKQVLRCGYHDGFPPRH